MAAPAPGPTPAPGPGDPRRLGGFELLECLGEGASATVFRARQLAPPRLVALKIMRSGQFATEAELNRFRLEAEAAATLRHPNIVPVLDTAVLDGWPSLVLQLIDGESLARRLHGTPDTPTAGTRLLPVRDSVLLLAKVARAVHFAHQHGLLHRDLKPGNILLDPQGEPHLTDFGAARWIERDPAHPPTLGHLGTPEYLAPELTGPDPASPTIASDVYSLGVILFELLSGNPPFRGATPQATLNAARRNAPPPLRRADKRLDPDLETLCLQCLDKDPERRYPSAAAFAEDLERWLAHRPVLARRTPPIRRAWKWVRRNPTVAALGMLLLISVLGGLSLALYQLVESRRLLRDTRLANLHLAEAGQRARFHEAEAELEDPQDVTGLLSLASLVRDAPSNTVATTRLFAALTQRQIPCPLTPPLLHDGPVVQGAFTGSTRQIVTAATDGWLRIWENSGTAEVARLPHESRAGRFALHPESGLLATLPPGGGLALWRLPKAEPVWSHPAAAGDAHAVAAVAFTPDGRWLLSGDTRGHLVVWSVTAGEAVAEADHPAEPVIALGVAANGSHALTRGPRTVQVWSLAPAHLADETPGRRPDPLAPTLTFRPEHPPVHAEFTPSADRLLVVHGSQADVWNLAPGELFRALQNNAPVFAAHFSTNGQQLVAANRAQRLHLLPLDAPDRNSLSFDLRSPITYLDVNPHRDRAVATTEDGRAVVLGLSPRASLLGSSIPHLSPLNGAVFSPGGTRVLTLGRNGQARVWNLDRALTTPESLPPGLDPAACEYSRSGGWAAIAEARPHVTVVNVLTPDIPPRSVPLATPPAALRFSPDGRWLALLDTHAALTVVATDRLTGPTTAPASATPAATPAATPSAPATPGAPFGRELPSGHPEPVLAWSPDSRYLARSSAAGVHLWATRTGWTTPLAGFPDLRPSRIEFDPRGAWLALAGEQPWLWLLRPDSITNTVRKVPLPSPATAFRFSPDGRRLVVATAGAAQARLYHSDTGEPVGEPFHAEAEVSSVAFSPDGRLVATGSRTGWIHLWNAQTGASLNKLGRSSRELLQLEFSPDGAWVLSLGRDGRLALTHVTTGLLGWTAAGRAGGVRAAFTDDGRHLTLSGPASMARRFANPAATHPPAALLVTAVEFTTGRRLTPSGSWAGMTATEWLACRDRIASVPGWTRFGPPPQARLVR